MIVLGADTHKRSHTIAAVAAATGELLGERTVAVGGRGFAALLIWARGLHGERVWALEDCRHVSGSFERFLIARGERVVRVPTRRWPTRAARAQLARRRGIRSRSALAGPGFRDGRTRQGSAAKGAFPGVRYPGPIRPAVTDQPSSGRTTLWVRTTMASSLLSRRGKGRVGSARRSK